MPTKFDTNPLDPDFPEKAQAAAAGYAAPPKISFKTAEFPHSPMSVTEEETRRFSEAEFGAYAFQGGQTPALYQTADLGNLNRASDRKVAKIGVAEKWLIGLPYLPFSIGLIAGLILLLVIPKEENKVRFHAAQGLAAHLAILIVMAIFGIVDNVSDIAEVGSIIFRIFTTIALAIFAIRAWTGKPVHIETVDDLTNWLEEKIGPIKS